MNVSDVDKWLNVYGWNHVAMANAPSANWNNNIGHWIVKDIAVSSTTDMRLSNVHCFIGSMDRHSAHANCDTEY